MLPYDFQGAGRSRRNVRRIVEDLYHDYDGTPGSVAAATDGDAIITRQAIPKPVFPDGEYVGDESWHIPVTKVAEADVREDLRGGVPKRTLSPARNASSPARPKSAIPSRIRAPQPMSLGAKKTVAGSRENRPASALARFSSDSPLGADALGLDEGLAEVHSERELDALQHSASTTKKMKKGVVGGGGFGGKGFVKGRPASALERTRDRAAMESGHGDQGRPGAAARRDKSLKVSKEESDAASIYRLMRHAADPVSKARAREVERFLERSQHGTVALPSRTHGPAHKSCPGGGEGLELELEGSEVTRQRQEHAGVGMSCDALQAARARADGQRPRALGKLIPTPAPRRPSSAAAAGDPADLAGVESAGS